MVVVLRQLWVRSWRPSRSARLASHVGGGAAETVDGLVGVGDEDQGQADVVEPAEDVQVGGGAVLRLVDHQFGVLGGQQRAERGRASSRGCGRRARAVRRR